MAADKSVIAGRTMEWAFDMQWTLVSLPKGSPVAMTAPPSLNLPTTNGASKYAVVGVKPAIIPGDTLLEGQNSAGLGMSGNFLPGFTQYQTVTPQDKSYVSILGFGAWVLGQFATVAEVRAGAGRHQGVGRQLAAERPDAAHPSFRLHRQERRQHRRRVRQRPAAHLRQRRRRADQRADLRLAGHQSAQLPQPLDRRRLASQVGEANVTALGQGGGLVGIPGDYTPPSRFVRCAFLRHYATQPKTADEAIQLIGAHPEQRRHPARHRPVEGRAARSCRTTRNGWRSRISATTAC